MGRARLGFARDTGGVAAVEFALVVPMLLGIIFTILEVGWIMVQTIMLDHALDRTVRDLRLGLIETPSQEVLRERICDEALVLADCTDNLAIELIPISSPSSYPTDAARCVERNSQVAPLLRFSPGGRSQTMFVRACIVVAPLTPLLGAGLGLPRDAAGDFRLISKSGFINEPAVS